MDKKFLKENNLLESVNRYNTILEYIQINGNSMNDGQLTEDGEDPNADPSMGGDPSAMGGAPGMDPSMGGDPGMDPSMGGDPSAMGGAPGMDPSMGGDPSAMGGTPDGGGVEGFAPQGGDPSAMGGDPGVDSSMGGDPSAMGKETDEEDEDEEVIDVDDLTDSQENTEKKVGRLSKKFDKLMTMLDNLEANLDSNSEKISSLRDEMEKRNPTPEEKLSLRSKDGYPFNISVDDYWKDKEATGNYSTEDDRNGEDSQIYKITKSDIDSESDWPSIAKSLDNDSFHMNLKDIMGY